MLLRSILLSSVVVVSALANPVLADGVGRDEIPYCSQTPRGQATLYYQNLNESDWDYLRQEYTSVYNLLVRQGYYPVYCYLKHGNGRTESLVIRVQLRSGYSASYYNQLRSNLIQRLGLDASKVRVKVGK